MRFHLPTITACLIICCSCGNTASRHSNDPYELTDTTAYGLTSSQEGNGGVYFRTELYTHRKDTSLTYVKVFNYGGKLAAIQFYKGEKKHGPTITYDEKGGRQLGTYYRNDTAVDMRPFK
ncbi:hypothetical protein [Chitinophaga tropicalis]|uniref:Uncharacterized protein n=1 Tax=Chitinophaga tropicalis TaxID=2683588 RepID=A0A7K1U9X7_9BACT|nr:hypothetical protein [Chitinophaga tropicalis]MVT11174.1 hypothetical protein [Chitinophaga tropicalis]